MNDTYVLNQIIKLANILEINDESKAYQAFDQIAVWANTLLTIKNDLPNKPIDRHWYPLIALPQPRQLVLIHGETSNTFHRTFLATGYHDEEYRPLDPWTLPNGDSFNDIGWKPLKWTLITVDLQPFHPFRD
jgi:hypothetical protein